MPIIDNHPRIWTNINQYPNIGVDYGTGTSLILIDPQGNLTEQSIVGTSLKKVTTPQTLTDGATITLNYTTGANAKVTLAGNRTLVISNTVAGSEGRIIVTQDATGSRTLTLPAGSLKVGGSIVLSTAAASVDILKYFYDGTNYYWTVEKAFA